MFAGAELRDRLSLGQKREDILAGLHRAIILRAMSLLARSGGVPDEFTFTGGVAKNPAAVAALPELVAENYGERTLNISADSIYTGALGAALFALRDVAEREARRMSADATILTAGIDVGSSAVKVAVVEAAATGPRDRWRCTTSASAAATCARSSTRSTTPRSQAGRRDAATISTTSPRTGEGELVEFRTRPLLRHDHARARRPLPRCPRRAPCSTSARCTPAPCASTSAAACWATA